MSSIIFESEFIVVKRSGTYIIVTDKDDHECVVIDKKELDKLYEIMKNG